MFFRLFAASLFVLLASLTTPQESVQEEVLPPGDDGKRIVRIREYMTKAGTAYKAKDYESAGKSVVAAQNLMTRAVENGKEQFRDVIEKEYKRISKAHELLAAQGVELPELVALPEKLGEKMETAGASEESGDEVESGKTSGVSFRLEVAPILVKNCGKCHVEGSRGKFVLKTFDDILAQRDGTAVVAGKADESLIIQVMDSGEMPPNGAMAPEEIDIVRDWIKQGAHFDGESEEQKKEIGIFARQRSGKRGR